MAHYDRRILVPYLQDVCSVEMLCAKLTRELDNAKATVNNISGRLNQKIENPVRPEKGNYSSDQDDNIGHFMYILILGIIPIGIAIWLWSAVGREALFFEVLLVLFAIVIGWIPGIAQILEAGYKADEEYQKAMNYYQDRVNYNEQIRQQRPQLRESLQQWQEYSTAVQQRLTATKKLLGELYSVNIIPSRYRNIYAAYYLYDYFSTCREDDLDKIIQTMLLDEIKQRLDKIILQNEQILLNQRVQQALLERQNRMVANNHREEMKRIANMERNQELQLDYQHMIAKNQMVTNFLLECEYLYK